MYYANFSVNNGTCLMESLKGKNLDTLRRKIKQYATAEIFSGNRGRITISEDMAVDDVRGTIREIEWYEAKWCGHNVRWMRKQ